MPSNKPTATAQVKIDFAQTFTTEQGAKVLRHLAKGFHLSDVTHIPGDPYETIYREGQRSVILHIMDMMKKNVDPVQVNEDQITRIGDYSY